MANPENLVPFKEGEDPRRNVNGRPKKLPPLDELLAKVLGDDEEGKSKAEEILDALFKKAAKGDTRAAEILLERGYGKVKQDIDVKGNIVLVFDKEDEQA